jgi:hypothetical protein
MFHYIGTDPAAGQPVSSRVKSRSRDDHVGRISPDKFQHGGSSLLNSVCKKAIPTYHCSNDFGFIAKCLPEGNTGTNNSGHCAGRAVSLVFASNPTEELIYVVDDAHD